MSLFWRHISPDEGLILNRICLVMYKNTIKSPKSPKNAAPKTLDVGYSVDKVR